MPSKSSNIYCSNHPSSCPYVIEVSFSESGASSSTNNSTISISGSIKSTGAAWDAFSGHDSYLRLYWHDNNSYTTDKLVATSASFYALGVNAKKTVSGSITVPHKSDGALSGYAILKFDAYDTSGGYCPPDSSVQTANTALTTIARASTISISGSNLGSAVTVTCTKASTGFTHTGRYKFGSSSWTAFTIATTTTSTATGSFTPALSLGSQIPNATSGTLTVEVTTMNGPTTVGITTKTATLNLPTSVIPTISSLTATRVDNGVPAAWGVYVKGYSKATVTINSPAGSNGSSVKSYSITGGGLNSTASSATTGILNNVGTVTFTATVTDTRGRKSAAKTASITVVDYAKPSINVSAYRCNSAGTKDSSGLYLRVTCSYSYASVSSKNTITRSVTCNGVSNTTFASGTAFTLAANCDTGSTYTLTATIKDGLNNSATATISIPTAARIMNIKSNGLGVCFGGFATRDNVLESAWPVYVNGTSWFSRSIYLGYGSNAERCLYFYSADGTRNSYLYGGNSASSVSLGAYDSKDGSIWHYDTSTKQFMVNKSLIVSNYSGGDVSFTLDRGSNANWRLLDTSGILKFQTDWSGSKGSYYDLLTIDCYDGKTVFKGPIDCTEMWASYYKAVSTNELRFYSGNNRLWFGYATVSGSSKIDTWIFGNGNSGKGIVECGKIVADNLAAGEVSITPTAANTPTKVTISYGKTFPSTPKVIVGTVSSVPGTTVLGAACANRTTTGCDLYISRTNTTATTVIWIAYI